MDILETSVFFSCDSPSEKYVDIISTVLGRGLRTSPRGMLTHELYRSATFIREPMKRLVIVPNRKINPFFLVAEAIWILAGKADADFIVQFNQGLSKFLDAGDVPFFHAPYGERIRRHFNSDKFGGSHLSCQHEPYVWEVDQVKTVVETLTKDPDSRRGVICLWDPFMDTQESNDIPCNDMAFFKVRENKLHMTVLNRSNDAILGFPVTNLFQFSMLMELIANLLEVGIGTYCQYSDSLHLYAEQDLIKDVLSVKYPLGYLAPVFPMRRMSVGLKENTLKIYDGFFRDLIYLVPKLCPEDISNLFPENLGSFRDFAFYIRCFLYYREKNYKKAWECLSNVADFNLFLAGLEFMYRAIKDRDGKALFDPKVNFGGVMARAEDSVELDRILKSAQFFLEITDEH